MSEKQYRRRLCDRSDGRFLKNLPPMHRIEPYIMVHRNDATNLIFDKVEVTRIEEYVRLKRKQGYKGFGMLHVMMASYVRVVSQRPAVNRFISGQKIYARNNIEVNIDIKKEMTIESPDTVVKIEFDAYDTAVDIYNKMKAAIEDNKGGLGTLIGIGAQFVEAMPETEACVMVEAKGKRNTGRGGLKIYMY